MAFTSITPEQKDSLTRAIARTLLQFRNSPVFQYILEAFITEIQAFQDAAFDLIQNRGPADATGVNLEAIGRIVGQDRTIFDYSELAWFAADTIGQGADQAPVWVTNAPLTESIEADDTWYRQLIEGRVHRNFTQYGSIPEIQEVARITFGIELSIYRTGPMVVQLAVPSSIPTWILNYLTKTFQNNYVENQYYLPYPATMSIDSVLIMPETSFTPDVAGAGADVGVAAVAIPIS